MHSNDVVFGYNNDFAWQKYVTDKLAADLKVPIGPIFWNVASLHVYERHFDLISDWQKQSEKDWQQEIAKAIEEAKNKAAAEIKPTKLKT